MQDSTISFSPFEKEYFMNAAIQEAQKAFNDDEVPVGCVFVIKQQKKWKIVAKSHNLTNKLKNSSRHCQINCIKELKERKIPVDECYLFVTVEPCIMCTHALNLMKIKKVYFGQYNDRFGGCGSVLNENKFQFEGGIKEEESLEILKKFYQRGNQRLPEEQRKRSGRKRVKKDEQNE